MVEMSQIAYILSALVWPAVVFYLVYQHFSAQVSQTAMTTTAASGGSLSDRMEGDVKTSRIVRQAVQSMGMSCLVLNSDLRVVDANQAFCGKLGYTTPDLVGSDIQRLLPPATRAANVISLRRLLVRSGFLEPCTLTVLDNQENVITLPVLLSRARFDDDWYLCLFVVMPDMLDRLCDLRDSRDSGLQVCNLGSTSPASLILP